MTPDDEKMKYHLKVMRLIENNPGVSQRELAEELGVSLGKVNYCLQAFVSKGLVKIQNFRNSSNKQGYIYLLTPEGVASKAKLTVQYLKIRIREYDALRNEIAQLQRDVKMDEVSSIRKKDV